MRDKFGNQLTVKEFMARWKDGISRITPLQQINNQLQGQLLVIIGILLGVYFSLVAGQFWLTLILVGSFMIAKMQMVSNYQKKQILLKLEGGVNE